jgi:hypothetical protein
VLAPRYTEALKILQDVVGRMQEKGEVLGLSPEIKKYRNEVEPMDDDEMEEDDDDGLEPPGGGFEVPPLVEARDEKPRDKFLFPPMDDEEEEERERELGGGRDLDEDGEVAAAAASPPSGAGPPEPEFGEKSKNNLEYAARSPATPPRPLNRSLAHAGTTTAGGGRSRSSPAQPDRR